MLTLRTRDALAVALVAAIATGGAWAAAQDASVAPDDAVSAAAVPGLSASAVAEVQPDIAANFALLRERPPGRMPEGVAAAVGSSKRYGRNAALARPIETVTGTGWVIPGNGYICLAVPDPVDGYGTTSQPTDVAIKQGIAITLWGNMPDDMAAETLVVPDGKVAALDTAGASRELLQADAGVVSRMTERPGALQLSE